MTLLHRFAPRLGRWWPQSLVGRVYVLYSVTLLLFVGVGLGLFYRYIEEQELQSVQQAADIMVNVAAQTVGDSAVIGDYDTIQRTLNKAVQHPYFASASFIDLGGAVLRSSNTPDTSLSAPAWLLQHLGEHLYEVNHVINVGGRDYGVLRIQFATEAIVGNLWALLRSALWLALAGLTGGLLLIHRPLKRWLGALDRAREFGQQAAQGQHSQVEQHIADMPPEFRPLFQVLSDTASSLRTELHTRENALQSLRHTLAGLQDLPGAATLENNNDLTKLTNTLNQLVTEREASRKVVERALDAAEAASRIKSEFLANMSHEIRTPMNGIVGMTALALTEPVSDDVREYLHTIDSSAKLLMVIINDILDFSKIEAGKLHVEHIAFDIRETVNDTLRAHRTQAETKGLRLHLDIAPDVPHGVGGDPVRLRQVLHNLVGNAIKFTAQGTVAVKLWQEAVPGQPNAQELHLAVHDTGIGIPEHKQATIFDAFAQADTSTTRQYGGTGLGLSISKRLVELMEGQLWVESVPGLGSTFHVTLPCHAMALPAATTLSPALQVPVTAPTTTVAPVAPAVATAAVAGRVLLVEDNLVNQRLAQGLLKKMGHEVTLAANGAEAVEAYRHATFDLVLMDMQMPVLSGPEACEQIRQHEAAHGLRHTPIMAMTANAMSKDSELCLAAGMDDFMSKPLDVHRFTERVAYWVQHSHSTRPQPAMPATHDEPPAVSGLRPRRADNA